MIEEIELHGHMVRMLLVFRSRRDQREDVAVAVDVEVRENAGIRESLRRPRTGRRLVLMRSSAPSGKAAESQGDGRVSRLRISTQLTEQP